MSMSGMIVLMSVGSVLLWGLTITILNEMKKEVIYFLEKIREDVQGIYYNVVKLPEDAVKEKEEKKSEERQEILLGILNNLRVYIAGKAVQLSALSDITRNNYDPRIIMVKPRNVSHIDAITCAILLNTVGFDAFTDGNVIKVSKRDSCSVFGEPSTWVTYKSKTTKKTPAPVVKKTKKKSSKKSVKK